MVTMENIKEYFTSDSLAVHLGIELVDVSPGKALARMQVQDHHFNTFGTVHGGAAMAAGKVRTTCPATV